MSNPFEIIDQRLRNIECLLLDLKHPTKQVIEPAPDRITDLSEVELLTGLKKSVIYKLTSTNEIPFSRFGKKLVFSRKELLHWIESRTVANINPNDAMVKQLSAAAKKKGVRK